MNRIADLQMHYARSMLGLSVGSAFIDWAIERLQADEEGEDLEVVLLAAATTEDESLPLAKAILGRYMPDGVELEFVAGKEIVNLRSRYLGGELSIVELDPIINELYVRLEYPSWLVMLSRNCEYATDIDIFEKPFEQEFEYIAQLWASSNTIAEFHATYSRAVSNTHDALPANHSLQGRRP